jgi:hypothetical protein
MGKNPKDKHAPVPLGPLHADRGSLPNGGRTVSPIGDGQDHLGTGVALFHKSSLSKERLT